MSLGKKDNALNVEISPSLAPVIGAVIARVKRLFDLGAVPDAVSALLLPDPLLADVVRRIPGLRVAGAFDGFELAVRAILGQQVSVKGATTLAGRWAQAFGTPDRDALSAAESADPERAAHGFGDGRRNRRARNRRRAGPLPGARSHRPCSSAEIVLTFAPNVEEQIEALMRLPGIGPWTAQYIAMRALHWPDAFPSGDLMLLRAANANQKQLQELARRLAALAGVRDTLSMADH